MRELHPDVRAALGMTRELRQRIAAVRDRSDEIVARRPSPSGLVIPEVDAMGRLRDLYLAPGTCARFNSQELAAEIIAAVTESTADARRQYEIAMNNTRDLPRPIAEVMREWRAGTDPNRPVPNFGKEQQ